MTIKLDKRTHDTPHLTAANALLRSLRDPPVAINPFLTDTTVASSAPAASAIIATTVRGVARADEEQRATMERFWENVPKDAEEAPADPGPPVPTAVTAGGGDTRSRAPTSRRRAKRLRPSRSPGSNTVDVNVAIEPGTKTSASNGRATTEPIALTPTTDARARVEPKAPTTALVGDGDLRSPGFAKLCEKIRASYEDLMTLVVRRYIEIADLIAQAKIEYDTAHNTGRQGVANLEGIPGFIEALHSATGIGKAMIAKYLQISKLAIEKGQLIAEHSDSKIGGNFTALLELARETDPEKMLDIVKERDVNGRQRIERQIERDPLFERASREPELKKLLKQFVDPKEGLGGVGPETAMPSALVQQFPELMKYPRVGDLRQAIVRTEQKRASTLRAPHRGAGRSFTQRHPAEAQRRPAAPRSWQRSRGRRRSQGQRAQGSCERCQRPRPTGDS
jgi:hypothetical protein